MCSQVLSLFTLSHFSSTIPLHAAPRQLHCPNCTNALHLLSHSSAQHLSCWSRTSLKAAATTAVSNNPEKTHGPRHSLGHQFFLFRPTVCSRASSRQACASPLPCLLLLLCSLTLFSNPAFCSRCLFATAPLQPPAASFAQLSTAVAAVAVASTLHSSTSHFALICQWQPICTANLHSSAIHYCCGFHFALICQWLPICSVILYCCGCCPSAELLLPLLRPARVISTITSCDKIACACAAKVCIITELLCGKYTHVLIQMHAVARLVRFL